MSVGLLVDLCMHIESGSTTGLIQQTNLFGGKLPATPVNACALLRTGSRAPEFVMGRVLPWREYYLLQAFVRHQNYTIGEAWIHDAYRLLSELVNVTVNNGPRIVECKPQQAPGYLGENEDGHNLFSVNFELSIEPQP